MSKEDEAELEADRLTAIQEDGQRESSDDGDNDDDDDEYDDEDPDDDLNFWLKILLVYTNDIR